MTKIKKNKSVSVIYISGDGHSGSTLLDILLGSQKNVFSSGELNNISREGLPKEFCSCDKQLSDCELWSDIFEKWLVKSRITVDEYRVLKLRYERNKATPRLLFNCVFPSKKFIDYCNSTKFLFETISEVTNCNTIIDSSKIPQRILVLKRIVSLRNIHLTRNLVGVLNSAKKSKNKNIKKGYETNIRPRRTSKTILDWVVKNLLVELFTIGVNSKKIAYDEFITNSKILLPFNKDLGDYKNKIFFIPHMIAGNALRLEKNIEIFKKPETNSNLSNKQLMLAKLIGIIFPFWK